MTKTPCWARSYLPLPIRLPTPIFVFTGYSVTDLNLDGKTVYAGAGNDLNTLLGNILLAPGNSTASTNYILPGSLPQ